MFASAGSISADDPIGSTSIRVRRGWRRGYRVGVLRAPHRPTTFKIGDKEA